MKKTIPSAVKHAVWTKYIGTSTIGKCICCETSIDIKSCVYGHIMSEKDGGDISIENLRPICLNCNSSMGTQNMVTFIKKCGFKLHSSLSDNGEKVITTTYNMRSQNMKEVRRSHLTFKVPDFQRIINQVKVDEIVEDFKTCLEGDIPYNIAGCIITATLYDNNEVKWIIDGLHRLTAYERILSEFGVDVKLFVNDHMVESYEEAKALFNVVNKTTPLPELPQAYDKINISKIVQYVTKTYPSFIKLSNKPQRPYINQNTLIEELSKYTIDENTIPKIEKLNEMLREYGYNSYLKKYAFTQPTSEMLEKVKEKGGFYLGNIPNCRWVEIALS